MAEMILRSCHPLEYKNGSYLAIATFDPDDKVLTVSVPCSTIYLRPTQIRRLINKLERELAKAEKK